MLVYELRQVSHTAFGCKLLICDDSLQLPLFHDRSLLKVLV